MTGAVFPELPVGFCEMHYAYVITRDEQHGRGARRKLSNFSLMEMELVSFINVRADTSPIYDTSQVHLVELPVSIL